MDNFIHASEEIALFCRMNVNVKKNLPIRSSEMGMLIYLVKTEGEKTPNAVAKFFNVTKAMATNMTTSLLKQEYIVKEQSMIDKRSFSLIPTKKAVELVESAYTEYFKTMTLLQEKMGKEKFAEFIDLLERANEILVEEKKNHE
ncbi:MarR family transcriptional regulator [Enterococcus sp. MJM12]|uniref:MarR family transcriptional regulator n=1 Tax=Candidatus Enterococcus myersii TaxID=2815322 RepID=A0ABS3H6S9_9ENTE|nr:MULTISPECIES: MarR family transcriptional regulator [unclassified Enterococcus]MBO0449161.1 MarR family transcriptional regulator [Enterococcus sp. MJM12]MCD1025373.1 MarR family transcriptional regulator [Enterococcus sp. SMC-9]